jgi:two-component system chemotaxis response regulator CheB
VAFELIVIGASMGGMRALETVLGALPPDFPVPIAAVLHRSVDSSDRLRLILQRHTQLRVEEPQDKDPLQPGCAYVAPPDYHLLVEPGSLALSTDAPVSHARPSIDVLFETAAEVYRSRLIGVVMTGANSDGSRGAARIAARGGRVIIQDPETAESPVMPRAAAAAVPAARVLPLPEIPRALVDLVSQEIAPMGTPRQVIRSAGPDP